VAPERLPVSGTVSQPTGKDARRLSLIAVAEGLVEPAGAPGVGIDTPARNFLDQPLGS